MCSPWGGERCALPGVKGVLNYEMHSLFIEVGIIKNVWGKIPKKRDLDKSKLIFQMRTSFVF